MRTEIERSKSRIGSTHIRAFIPDVLGELHRNGARLGKVIAEAGENFLERLQPTGEQKMRMPILRRARPRYQESLPAGRAR